MGWEHEVCISILSLVPSGNVISYLTLLGSLVGFAGRLVVSTVIVLPSVMPRKVVAVAPPPFAFTDTLVRGAGMPLSRTDKLLVPLPLKHAEFVNVISADPPATYTNRNSKPVE